MKTIPLTLVLVCAIAASVYGYDKTLISDQAEIGGFVAPSVRFVEVRQENGLLMGGRIGLVVNHVFSLGACAYGSVAEPSPDDLPGLEALDIGYGGLCLEYTFRPHDALHVSVPVMIGGGKIWFRGAYVDPESGEDSEVLFVVEPEIAVEFNLTRNWRLNLGAAYLHVNGTDLADFTDEDLSGVSWVFTMKFGSF